MTCTLEVTNNYGDELKNLIEIAGAATGARLDWWDWSRFVIDDEIIAVCCDITGDCSLDAAVAYTEYLSDVLSDTLDYIDDANTRESINTVIETLDIWRNIRYCGNEDIMELACTDRSLAGNIVVAAITMTKYQD